MFWATLGAIAGLFARQKAAQATEAPGAVFGDYPEPPPSERGAPFALGIVAPMWPVTGESNNARRKQVSYRDVDGKYHGSWGRVFKASRSDGRRYHAGIDIYANVGDLVLATEPGIIVNHYHFYQGVHALIIQGDSGLVVNYGEVAPGSWKEFGLKTGDHVKRGQAIARVGEMNSGSHMLHFETYRQGTK